MMYRVKWNEQKRDFKSFIDARRFAAGKQKETYDSIIIVDLTSNMIVGEFQGTK